MVKTLGQSIKEWMERYKRNSVKPTTYDRLETSYSALMKHGISNLGICDISSDDIQDYIDDLVEDGYALSTIKKQYHLITGYMRFAHIKGIIPRPIYEEVNLPVPTAVKKKPKEIQNYSRMEQMDLMEVLKSCERIGYGAAILMMETGLRVGECLALGWNDIQWERRAVRVDKTLIRIANRHLSEVQDGAKSYTSNRTIPLSKNAMRLLQELYLQTQDRNGFVFACPDGKPLSYEALRYQIQCACEEARVPYKGQHVFRHTFATNCYYRGCDVKILSKLLGHMDVTVTYNVYIHLFGDALEEMRSVVG